MDINARAHASEHASESAMAAGGNKKHGVVMVSDIAHRSTDCLPRGRI